jgi:hypothetical protein
MPPKLIVLHERRMPPIDPLPSGAPSHISVHHPALDGKAAFRQVLPGMPLRDRRPLNRQLLKTRLQRHEYGSMITDDGVRRAPLRDRLVADLDHAGEVLSVEAARSHEGPTVPVEQQDAIEPMPVDRDQMPHLDTPDLTGSGRGEGTCFRPRRVRWRFGSGMGLCVEGHQLPDGGMPIHGGVVDVPQVASAVLAFKGVLLSST